MEKHNTSKHKGNIFKMLIVLFSLVFIGSIPSFATADSAMQQMDRINNHIKEIFQKKEHVMEKGAVEGSIQKCATPIIRYALKHKELLWPENRFILYRPTDSADKPYYGNVEIWNYDTDDGHFKLHYTENNRYYDAVPESDGDPNTIPDYILNLASYFEYAWKIEIDEMGYEIKSFDGSIGGGTNLIDIYVLGITDYGYTSIDYDESAYIVMDNDLIIPHSDDPNGRLKVTAAHELFHVIQFDYDRWYEGPDYYMSNIWWEESTATWMEDEVYDHVNDYIGYLRERLINLDLPLDEDSVSSTNFLYGGVIWAKYLSETYGRDIIYDIFLQCSLINPHLAKPAIGYTIQSQRYNSNWAQAMIEFCHKTLTRDYEEADIYLPIYEKNIYNNTNFLAKIVTPEEIENSYWYTSKKPIKHLSCHFFKIQSGKETKDLYLRVSSSQSGKPPITILFADMSKNEGPTKESIHIYTYTDQMLELNGFGEDGTYPQAYIVIINPDPDPKNDDCYYSWTLGFEPPTYNPLQEQTLFKSASGGCFLCVF